MPLPFTVAPALPAEVAAACRVLASGRPAGERDAYELHFLVALKSGEIDSGGLLVARDGAGSVRGAMLGQEMAGAVGLVWPPVVEAREGAEAIGEALVAAVVGRLQSAGVKVCQTFPASGDRAGVAALERGGFRAVTKLSLWKRSLADARDTAPPTGLAFEPIGDSGRAGDFADALLATYEGSRDCPESTGTRTALETVSGYGSPPTGEPLWFLARDGSGPVGTVLLAAGDAPGAAELAYLGLVPAARGRGLGRALLRFALARAAGLGYREMGLSVDVRNEPALRLYRGHGFRPYEVRDVYLRVE